MLPVTASRAGACRRHHLRASRTDVACLPTRELVEGLHCDPEGMSLLVVPLKEWLGAALVTAGCAASATAMALTLSFVVRLHDLLAAILHRDRQLLPLLPSGCRRLTTPPS